MPAGFLRSTRTRSCLAAIAPTRRPGEPHATGPTSSRLCDGCARRKPLNARSFSRTQTVCSASRWTDIPGTIHRNSCPATSILEPEEPPARILVRHSWACSDTLTSTAHGLDSELYLAAVVWRAPVWGEGSVGAPGRSRTCDPRIRSHKIVLWNQP